MRSCTFLEPEYLVESMDMRHAVVYISLVEKIRHMVYKEAGAARRLTYRFVDVLDVSCLHNQGTGHYRMQR